MRELMRKMCIFAFVTTLLLGGNKAFATVRYCTLNNEKRVESQSCTVGNQNRYFVFSRHGQYSNSSKMNVVFVEWNQSKKAYDSYTLGVLSRGVSNQWYPNARNGLWAKIRLEAQNSKGSGAGSISNER